MTNKFSHVTLYNRYMYDFTCFSITYIYNSNLYHSKYVSQTIFFIISIIFQKVYNMSYIFSIFTLILHRWQILNNIFLNYISSRPINSPINYLQWHMLTFSYIHELLYSQDEKVLSHLVVNKIMTLSPLWVYSRKFKWYIFYFQRCR